MNTTSAELSNLAIEVSVWDMEGGCPFYKVTEIIVVPPKKVVEVVQLKYPDSKNARPVYFLLLKLFRVLDSAILSRNFYWLHLPGKDFRLLEPYREKRVPLKITSDVLVSGPSYKVNVRLKNLSRSSRSLICKAMDDKKDSFSDMGTSTEFMTSEQSQRGILRRISGALGLSRPVNSPIVVEVNGEDSGIAFFLHFSVHAASEDQRKFEDTRILPIHYSDNYFSLVPGETMNVTIDFEVPSGVTPRITLSGWNYPEDLVII